MAWGRPERILLLACLAVVVAVCYDVARRVGSVPSVMGYMPVEGASFVVTPPLRTLWNAGRPHVGQLFEALPPTTDAGKKRGATVTPARASARQLRKNLEENKIVLRDPEDLPAIGIDPAGHAAIAMIDETVALFVLPVLDQDKFRETLERLTGEKITVEEPMERAGRRLYKSGGMYFAFGADGAAVMAFSDALLQSALKWQVENLAYFRSNDRLLRELSALQRGRGQVAGAILRGSVTLADSGISLVGNAPFVLMVNEHAAVMRTRVRLPETGDKSLDRLVAAPMLADVQVEQVLTLGNGAVVLLDKALPDFVRDLTRGAPGPATKQIEALFPGLLNELQGIRSFDRLSVNLSEESQRVPGVILGLRMSAEEADNLVFRLQRALRLKRDQDILTAATEKFREEADETRASDATVAELLSGEYLSEERRPFWRRYRLKDGRVLAEPPLKAPDFATDAYSKTDPGLTMRYIMPPVTTDDFKYRFKRGEEVNDEALKQDKYRLCSAYVDGTLWLGNDADVLGRWLARLPQPRIDPDYTDVNAYAKDPLRTKLSAIGRPPELFESGILYPDPDVNKATRASLSDLRQYRIVSLTVTTNPSKREIDATGTFLLR